MHNSCLLFTNVLVAFKHLIDDFEITICILLKYIMQLTSQKACKN